MEPPPPAPSPGQPQAQRQHIPNRTRSSPPAATARSSPQVPSSGRHAAFAQSFSPSSSPHSTRRPRGPCASKYPQAGPDPCSTPSRGISLPQHPVGTTTPSPTQSAAGAPRATQAPPAPPAGLPQLQTAQEERAELGSRQALPGPRSTRVASSPAAQAPASAQLPASPTGPGPLHIGVAASTRRSGHQTATCPPHPFPPGHPSPSPTQRPSLTYSEPRQRDPSLCPVPTRPAGCGPSRHAW